MSRNLSLGLKFDPQNPRQPIPAGVVMQKPAGAKALPTPPLQHNLLEGRTNWSALGNIFYPVCTLAAVLHAIQVAGWYAMKREIAISDDEVLRTHANLTGWTGNIHSENMPALSVKTALDFASSSGLAGCRVLSWYRSNWLPGDGGWWQDRDCLSQGQLKSHLAWFGGLVIAVRLPRAAYENDLGPWLGTGMADDSVGGHCLPLVGYDGNWFNCISWGKIVRIDWTFIKRFTSETYFFCSDQWSRWDESQLKKPALTPDYGLTQVEIIDTMAAYAGMELFNVAPWP